MWNRIRRIFRAMFGWLVRGAEDPELILRQLRDDLRDKIPELNRQVAEIVKHQKMLEMQLERQTDRITQLRPQVETAVKSGPARKEAAKTLIVQLQQAEKELADTQAALARASENSQRMLTMRDAYERKIKEQMQEAMRQVSRHRRAQVESEMAEIMGSFEVGDEVDTLQRMTERIDERLARAQARLEVSQSSVDTQIAEIETEASMDSAELAYQEYQKQLGLVADTGGEAPKTMESIPLDVNLEPEPPMPPEQLEEEDTSADPNWARSNEQTQDEN